MKPTAYVLNLDRRPDRWQRTKELWSEFFELVRVPATDMPHNGARGCKLSHCGIAAKVLENEPMVIVLEDDSEPTPDFASIGMACLAEARAHLYEWDCANLSPLLDLSAMGLPCSDLFRTESPFFLRATYSHSTNMVIYNHSTLPILQSSLMSRLPIDMYLTRHAAAQWTPIRLLATQTFGDSDIRPVFDGQKGWYAKSAEMLQAYETTTPICHGSS